MTNDDRIALINDTTTIDSLSFALKRSNETTHGDGHYNNYSLGDTQITASDWQQHWTKSDRMFDDMWNGTTTQE